MKIKGKQTLSTVQEMEIDVEFPLYLKKKESEGVYRYQLIVEHEQVVPFKFYALELYILSKTNLILNSRKYDELNLFDSINGYEEISEAEFNEALTVVQTYIEVIKNKTVLQLTSKI